MILIKTNKNKIINDNDKYLCKFYYYKNQC